MGRTTRYPEMVNGARVEIAGGTTSVGIEVWYTVKEARKKDEGKRMRVGQEEMQGGRAIATSAAAAPLAPKKPRNRRRISESQSNLR